MPILWVDEAGLAFLAQAAAVRGIPRFRFRLPPVHGMGMVAVARQRTISWEWGAARTRLDHLSYTPNTGTRHPARPPPHRTGTAPGLLRCLTLSLRSAPAPSGTKSNTSTNEGAHDSLARTLTARRGVSSSRPWGLATTVPTFPVPAHPAWSRSLVTGILITWGASVSSWRGRTQPVAFRCHV